MHITELDFNLPPDLIAAKPLESRSASRMMHVNRDSRTFEDKYFTDVVDHFSGGDLLVINNTRVFPARLFGVTETASSVEIFLIRPLQDRRWEALARPGRRLPIGKRVDFSNELSCRVTEKHPNGTITVRFNAKEDLDSLIDRTGKTPLPPYIHRDRNDPDTDRERYQTVYASKRGAIAAPTAGLHFTRQVLDQLKEKGIQLVEITLHVGYGTFEPVRVVELGDHRVQPERYEINEVAAATLEKARSDGRRIIAVGTTTTRTLETVIGKFGEFRASSGDADLTILPGYRFRAINGLLTNFHLPKSSLLVLVSTFAGHRLIMAAYQHAIAERYRFYSYGDCMFID